MRIFSIAFGLLAIAIATPIVFGSDLPVLPKLLGGLLGIGGVILVFSALFARPPSPEILEIDADEAFDHARPPLRWVCSICGHLRDDAKISVAVHDISGRFGMDPGSAVRNVKHCNDREICIEAARKAIPI